MPAADCSEGFSLAYRQMCSVICEALASEQLHLLLSIILIRQQGLVAQQVFHL